MKTRADELPLFAGASRGRTGKQRNESKVRTLSASPPQPTRPYAGIFWLCDSDSEAGKLLLTIGWAVQQGANQCTSGAWSLNSELPPHRIRPTAVISPVEETRGAIFPRPTELEERLNAHAERLLSDWLLFLVHRMPFGQCKNLEKRISSGTVDCCLLYGPLLPKFVGRVCYTNYTHTKTLAVLAPYVRRGANPQQTSSPWLEEPLQRFCHDCGQRSWSTSAAAGNPSQLPRIATFDLIEPTGDGLPGKILPAGPDALGPAKWLRKASMVQQILDHDSVEVKLVNWPGETISLPRGLKAAARAALLQRSLDEFARRTEPLRARLSAESQRSLKQHDDRTSREIVGIEGDELLKSAVRARARLAFTEILCRFDLEGRPDVHTPPKSPPLVEFRKELVKMLGASIAD